MTSRRHRWSAVDVVAVILALSMAGLVLAIIIETTIQIAEHVHPLAQLGENGTQILTAIVGGFVGLLGTYIGYRVRDASEGAAGSTRR